MRERKIRVMEWKIEIQKLEKGDKNFIRIVLNSFGNYISQEEEEEEKVKRRGLFDHERRVPSADNQRSRSSKRSSELLYSLLCRKLHLHFILHDLLANGNRVDPQTGYFWYLSCARVSQLIVAEAHDIDRILNR